MKKLSAKPLTKALVTSGLLSLSATAAANDFYVSGSYGFSDQDNTSNRGVFTADFTTGAVTGVTPPLLIPADSAVGWNTRYRSGHYNAFAFGWTTDIARFELEYNINRANIRSHNSVVAGGIDLSDIDAGVLISGNSGDLGVSVANLVADGQGRMRTTSWMVNGIYDFDMGGMLTPYLGLGIGSARTDLRFVPSGVGVLDDSDRNFAWQFIAGLNLQLTEVLSAFANYRYVDSGKASLDASLLPANFDVNNKSQLVDIGLRFAF